MKRVNQYQFYQIGAAVHPAGELADDCTFADVADDCTFADAWSVCFEAQRAVETLLANTLTPIVTCRSAASKLRGALGAGVPDWGSLDQQQQAETVLGSWPMARMADQGRGPRVRGCVCSSMFSQRWRWCLAALLLPQGNREVKTKAGD